MLTEECKEKLYSTIQDFKIYYCGNYFNEPRATFEIENWFGNTYKLNITPDIMAVGKVNDNKINQDYITVVKTNGEYKLNINSYIGRTKINVEKEQNNINIKINYKDTYMDYEEFNITAQNNNNKKICLDTKQDVNTMYLEDRNKVQYSAITSEISDRTLVINEKKSNTIDIKYYSRYGSTKIISKIVFSNIILDYDQYESNGRSREMEIAINL